MVALVILNTWVLCASECSDHICVETSEDLKDQDPCQIKCTDLLKYTWTHAETAETPV